MRQWEKGIRRTAVALLGAALLSGSVGVSAQAGEAAPPTGTEVSGAQGTDGKTTIMSFEPLSDKWQEVVQVPLNAKESDVKKDFPTQITVNVVVQAENTASGAVQGENPSGAADSGAAEPKDADTGVQSSQPDAGEGGNAPQADGTDSGQDGASGSGSQAPGISGAVVDETKTYTTPKEEHQQIRVGVQEWRIDPENSYKSNFDSRTDAIFTYVPVIAQTDKMRMGVNAGDTLPRIMVAVGNVDMPSTTADADYDGGNEEHIEKEAYNVLITVEKSLEDTIDVLAQNRFVIKGGNGNYTVSGVWTRPLDQNGNPVNSSNDPFITIEGSGDYTITLAAGVKLDTSDNSIGKGIIYIKDDATVKLVSEGGSTIGCNSGTEDTGWRGASVLEVGSKAKLSIWDEGGSAADMIIAGKILNNGQMTIEKSAPVTVKGPIQNNGNLTVTQQDNLVVEGSITNEGTMTLAEKAKLDGRGSFYNYGKGLVLNEDSVLKTGAFSNASELVIPRGATITASGDFANAGSLEIGGESELAKNANLQIGGSLDNGNQKFVIGKRGIVTVGASLENSGNISISSWTLPNPPLAASTEQDGGQLLVGSTSGVNPELINSGTIEIGEGGLLSTNGVASLMVTNSGTLRMANAENVTGANSCLGSGIRLKTGFNENGEESGEFYLTDITSNMIIPIEGRIAYNGTAQYREVFQKFAYQKEYELANDYPGIIFQVTPASGWTVDLYNNGDGTGDADHELMLSSNGDANGDYYVVYKHANRRKAPANWKFHMYPATMLINQNTAAAEISKEHPDYNKMFGWDPEEEEIRKGYELGNPIKIQVDLAIELRRGAAGRSGKSLLVTVKDPSGAYVKDTAGHELNAYPYEIAFDNDGKSLGQGGSGHVTIDIATVAQGVPIEAGAYDVDIKYVESELYTNGGRVEDETKQELERDDPQELYVLRTFPQINLSEYTGEPRGTGSIIGRVWNAEFTYGDEILNPNSVSSEGKRTVEVENYYGNASVPVDCEWFYTNDLEEVQSGNRDHFVGSTFPTKEYLQQEYRGVVAGDYILKVMVGDDNDPQKASKFTTPGVAYVRVKVKTKLVKLTVSEDPVPYKTYGSEDPVIEYGFAEGFGLVPGDEEEGLVGNLTRTRDRENVEANGSQGPARLDKVGDYIITRDEFADGSLNPNYEVQLAKTTYKFQIVPKDLNWGVQNLIVAEQDNQYKVYGGLTLLGLLDEDKGAVGVTYDKLTVSDDGANLEVTNPEIIDIWEGSGNMTNYNPPSSNKIPINESIFQLSVTEGSITHVSEAIKKTGRNANSIATEMTTAVKTFRNAQLGTKSDSDYKLYDVVVKRDGTPVEDIFQKGGLMVTIPYPAGTDKSYNFVALHMITSDIEGAREPGTLEQFSGQEDKVLANGQQLYKIEKTDEGLVIKVTGLSPVAIAWASGTGGGTTDPDDPNNPDNPNNPNNPDNPNNPNNPNDPNNPSNGNNNTNNGNNSSNNNDKNNSSTNKDDNKNTGSTSTTNKNGTTTRTSGVATGDTAPILFYSLSALAALLLLIFIICMVRKRKKED